jgi:hypothetical protein
MDKKETIERLAHFLRDRAEETYRYAKAGRPQEEACLRFTIKSLTHLLEHELQHLK